MLKFPFPRLPPAPLRPGLPSLAYARRALEEGKATVDQVWEVRRAVEPVRNAGRRRDWEIRFKVLGAWS